MYYIPVDVDALRVAVTEGHVAAAAALMQEFATKISKNFVANSTSRPPTSLAIAPAGEEAEEGRARGWGISLAAALGNTAVRALRAAERFVLKKIKNKNEE